MQCQTYQYEVAESSESPADELALDVYGQPSEKSAGRTFIGKFHFLLHGRDTVAQGHARLQNPCEVL